MQRKVSPGNILDITALPPELLEHHIFPYLAPPSLIAYSMVSKKIRRVILKEFECRKKRLRAIDFVYSPKLSDSTSLSCKYLYLMIFEEGSVQLLDFFVTRLKYPPIASLSGLFIQLCFSYALMGEHLNMLKTLKAAGHPLTNELAIVAASRGQLATLIWLNENGCELSPDCLVQAQKAGHAAVIDWLSKQIPKHKT